MRDFLEEIIVKAGELLSEQFGLQHIVEYKAEGKYQTYPQAVTALDQRVHEFLAGLILERFPDHHILSEESTGELTESGYTWLIDPIDGTTHFSRGLPNYSVSVALYHKGDVILGATYAPYYSDLYVAEKGQGAFCNHLPISVSKTNTLREALIASAAYQSYKLSGLEQSFFNVAEQIKNLRMFASPALDLCYVASGKLEARIFANTEAWDYAASALIVEEAGGLVTEWSGKRWTLKSEGLVASNAILHDQILRILAIR